jgi:hypothetical protein
MCTNSLNLGIPFLANDICHTGFGTHHVEKGGRFFPHNASAGAFSIDGKVTNQDLKRLHHCLPLNIFSEPLKKRQNRRSRPEESFRRRTSLP